MSNKKFIYRGIEVGGTGLGIKSNDPRLTIILNEDFSSSKHVLKKDGWFLHTWQGRKNPEDGGQMLVYVPGYDVWDSMQEHAINSFLTVMARNEFEGRYSLDLQPIDCEEAVELLNSGLPEFGDPSLLFVEHLSRVHFGTLYIKGVNWKE